jgi:AcrR family transcriptional regulator
MIGLMPRATARLSREEKKAMTRSKLLDAAAAVFARKGFNGASLDDVADEAGLTKGAVYSNFASKDDLIEVLLDERLTRQTEELGRLIDQQAAPGQEAEIGGALFMSYLEENRDYYLLDFEYAVHLARNPQLARRSSEGHARLEHAMAEIMKRRAAEEGYELPLPVEDLTKALFALGSGITLQRLIDPARVPDELFARMLALIFEERQDADDPPAGSAGTDGKAKR